MRIADEIDHVMREFVAFEDLFKTLVEEQKIEPYQVASWLLRNEARLHAMQMIECNRGRRDYRVLTQGWVNEYLYDLAAGDDLDWDELDNHEGYRSGWLESDLQRFFAATKVDYPSESLAARLRNAPLLVQQRAPSVAVIEDVEDVLDKELGTRERTTLLAIIAAVAQEANLSFATASKSAEIIASITERMGAPVAKRTIEEHLKKIPDALDRKSR